MRVPERSAQNSRASAATASAAGELAATLPPGSRPPAAQNATEAGGGAAGGGAGGGGLGDGLGVGTGDGDGSGDGDGDGLGEGHPTAGHIRRRGSSAWPRCAVNELSTTSPVASTRIRPSAPRTAIARSIRERSRRRIPGTTCSGYRVTPRSGRWCPCQSSKGRGQGSL